MSDGHLLVLVRLRSTGSRIFLGDDFRRRFHYSIFAWLDSGYTLMHQSMEVKVAVLHEFAWLVI